MPGGITGPPYQWGVLKEKSGPPGWGLETRLMTMLCKKYLLLQNPKK
jgi:hypothetical protein